MYLNGATDDLYQKIVPISASIYGQDEPHSPQSLHTDTAVTNYLCLLHFYKNKHRHFVPSNVGVD